jgi:hypothetical protein
MMLNLGILGLCTSCAAGGSEERVFVETLGTDTLAVEQYFRTGDRIEGRRITRLGATQIVHYVADLGAEGDISRLSVDWMTPAENPDGPAPRSAIVTMNGDSATVELTGGDNAGTTSIAVTEHTIPMVGLTPLALGLFEHAVMQGVESGQDSMAVDLLYPGRQRLLPNKVVRFGGDSVRMDYFGMPILASVNEDGELTGRSGEETTMKVMTHAVQSVDIDALASDFASRDARGEGIGTPSPTAEVQATLGPATIEITYSQPAARGREIWGGLVPYGEVWRTGANAATSFTTSRDLMIGDQRVPAGSYTLWSTFTADSATLVINSQTGQWGTQYDMEQDFVRVPLERETLDEPVERFTIDIVETDAGGALQLTWDDARYSVPIRIP